MLQNRFSTRRCFLLVQHGTLGRKTAFATSLSWARPGDGKCEGSGQEVARAVAPTMLGAPFRTSEISLPRDHSKSDIL